MDTPYQWCVLVVVTHLMISSAAPTKGIVESQLPSGYVGLNYDRAALLEDHSRILRRSAQAKYKSYIRWSFQAHNREFIIQISPDPEIFTKDFSVETDEEFIEFDRNRAYVGHVVGRSESQVAGILLQDGRFEGKIIDGEDDFFVERVESVLSDELQPPSDEEQVPSDEETSFHSVIYRLSDIDMSAFENVTDCKSDMLRDAMKVKARGVQVPGAEYSYEDGESSKHPSVFEHHNMYSADHRRGRRAIDPIKTMCELYIQADYEYYKRWGSNVDTVIEQLTAHVQAVNSIYRNIDFNGDGERDNIRFVIKKMKIWTDTNSGYPFSANLDVKNFLDRFSSQANFDSFCLAYTFTHRDFNDGTLGLAWTATLDASGGVCTPNGVYNGASTSLNTGIVTTLNFQQSVVFAISQLTFAHELAHNFGSEHDSESDSTCSPGNSNGGNYIMFPKATDGDNANNRKFSSCSIQMMNDVLNDKARHSGSTACFKEYSSTVCGNMIVEDGEQCDCGWADQCTEQCCNPQKDSYDVGNTPCTYTAGAVCSPSEGACCGDDCKVRSESDNYQCRGATYCSKAASCDGTGVCPPSAYEPNGTDCAGLVCYLGECSNAVCQAFGYQQCQCAPENEDSWSDDNLCKLCCMEEGACTLSSEIAAITKEINGVRGQPCFEYQGFCDAFLKCRKLDPVGAINSLQLLFSSEEGLATVMEWVKGNWYIIASVVVGFIIIMALVLKFCAKHEPIFPPEPVASKKNQVLPK